jgi:DNA-binding FadR family transcriptional regulator
MVIPLEQLTCWWYGIAMFASIQKKSLATEVFDQLRGHIVSGALDAGEALPSERALAEKLGVSRPAVREGLKRLEQAGLVSIQQGGATRVLAYRESAGLELLAALIVSPEGQVDTEVVRGILELRAYLGPFVAVLAAGRRDDAAGARLVALADEMEGARDDVATLQRLALRFWGQLVECSGNVALQLSFNSLVRSYEGVMDQLQGVLAAEVQAVDDYQAAAHAVANADEESASVAAASIIKRGTVAVEELLALLDDLQGGQP